MKKIILLSIITTLSFSSIVSEDLIKKDSSTIQIAVLKSKEQFNTYIDKFNQYDLFIEKLNNYTLYIVNIEKSKKQKVLKKIRKIISDAFLIEKKQFHKEKIIEENNFKEDSSINLDKKIKYDIALNYFRKKDYIKSYELFSELFLNDMGNILVNFYLGRSAYELKKYEFAISAYDRILIQEPTNNRVRLELAQTYLQMKLYTQSIKEFETTLNGDLPQIVRKKVESNITFMKTKQKKHFFDITAVLGLIYDSNINTTSDVENFDIYSPTLNGIVTLTNSEEKESTMIYQLAGIANYKYKYRDDFIFDNSASILMLKYNNHKEKDIHALSLKITPTYFQKKYKIATSFLYDKIYLGHEGYQNNFYLNPKYSRVFSKKSLFDFGLKVGRINYNNEQDKDANIFEIQNKYSYLTDNYGVFFLGLNLGKEMELNSTRTDVSQDYYNIFLSNSYTFPNNYTLQSSISYKNSKYKDIDVNFLSRRNDKKLDSSINLQKTITERLLINFGLTYTNNTSNHESFDYGKYTLKTNLIYGF